MNFDKDAKDMQWRLTFQEIGRAKLVIFIWNNEIISPLLIIYKHHLKLRT